jgi:hypothetical protein
MSDADADASDPRAGGREWLYLGLVVTLVVTLAWSLYLQYFLSQLGGNEVDHESREALFAQIGMVSHMTSIAGLLASAAVLIGLTAAARGAHGGARALLHGALVVVAVTMAVDLLFLFYELKGPQPVDSTAELLMKWARHVNLVATPVSTVLLACGAHGAGAQRGARAPSWTVAVACVGAAIGLAVALMNVFGDPGGRERWLSWVSLVAGVAAVGGCVVLARVLARSERGPEGWPRVAAGLDLFARALIARVGLAIGGTALLLFAAFGARSISMVKVVSILLPLANLGCLTAMAAAAIRLRAAPEPAAIRGIAAIAALLLLVSTAISGHVMMASFAEVDGGNPRAAIALGLMRQELGAGMAALLAITLVIDCARRIAAAYGETETAGRAVGLMAALLVVIGGQTLLQYRPLLLDGQDPGTGVMLILGAGIGVLIVVLMTGRLARDLVAVIDRGAPPARAIARVRED